MDPTMADSTNFSASTGQRPTPHIIRWIAFYGSVVCIPITVLMLLLIGLTFRHAFPASTTTSDAYYVDFNLSDILTVSSWCATIAVLLAGFVMTLFSFIVARAV